MYKFPNKFWWGAATSGPQSEGSFDKPHKSIMDAWYEENPKDFFNQVGPVVASDFYHHFKEDMKLLREAGIQTYRTSIQWTRLIDDFETGSINEKGAQFYRDVIKAAKENHIELIFNLHHFDMPVELLEKYGGWESKHVVDLFVKFAQAAFSLYANEVKYWTTFNEPIVIVEACYLYGFHYPKYKGKGKEAMQVLYNLNLASAKAIQTYKQMNYKGQIGIILNVTPSYPASDSKEDIEAGNIADLIVNRSFLDPAVLSDFPEELVQLLEKDGVLWESTSQEMNSIHSNKVDFLGVNYYHPKRVKANIKTYQNWMPDQYYEDYFMPGCRMNPYRGWEIYPQAIYDIAMNIKDNYGNIPWYISENGMGVEGEERFWDENGNVNDDYRIEFYEEHLQWLNKAIQEGSNCFGFHAWTGIDCWSWNNAYKNRYGFIALDLKSQKRTIKKSGHWFYKVSEENGFEGNQND